LRGTAWLPLALLAFDGFLESGRWRYVASTALVLALEGSGTDPQYVMFAALLLFLSPWLRPLPATIARRKSLAAVVAAGSLASTRRRSRLSRRHVPPAPSPGQACCSPSDRTLQRSAC